MGTKDPFEAFLRPSQEKIIQAARQPGLYLQKQWPSTFFLNTDSEYRNLIRSQTKAGFVSRWAWTSRPSEVVDILFAVFFALEVSLRTDTLRTVLRIGAVLGSSLYHSIASFFFRTVNCWSGAALGLMDLSFCVVFLPRVTRLREAVSRKICFQMVADRKSRQYIQR